MSKFFRMQPLLAADGAAGGGAQGAAEPSKTEPAAAKTEEPGAEPAKEEPVSFADMVTKNPEYKAAMDKHIADAVVKAQADAQAAAAEQAELDKLPDDQKATAKLRAAEERADRLQAEKDAILLRQEAAAMLGEKKLPANMVDMVVGADKEATAANVAALEAAFGAAVEAAVKEKLPGYTPAAGNAQDGGSGLMRAAMGLSAQK